MLDPRFLRQDPEAVLRDAKRHGVVLDMVHFSALEAQRKQLQEQTQASQATRNQLAKRVGEAKSQGKDTAALLKEAAELGTQLKSQEQALVQVQEALRLFQLGIPNRLHDSVPEGKSEQENVEVRRWGESKVFSFTPKDHVDLGLRDQAMDFEAAAQLSGARFVVLRDKLAALQRALANFMLDIHTREHGYTEYYIPLLVHAEALYGTGQLPKFTDDFFTVKAEKDFILIPTAEVALANLLREKILDAKQLPLKLVTHSPCFRSEAGSYGKDTRGMIRQHQFQKVELVQIVAPERSYDTLEEITGHAEKILQLLELPYRVVLLCAGDTGFTAAKTYDLEVWLPSQKTYREISSCSNCEDFQARRMLARYRAASGKPELVHTLNASGLAVGRTLVAIMENYQDAEGNIHVPRALQPYMGGLQLI